MEAKHKKTLLAQVAQLLLVSSLSFSANAANTNKAWSTTENYLDSAITYKIVDGNECFQASPKSLLEVSTYVDVHGKRVYSIAQVSDIEKEKNIYATPLEDQINMGIIVAKSFCKGVASISNMNLPFAKGANGVMDANDGMVMLNTLRHDLNEIMDQLNEMTALANQAASGVYSSSELSSMNIEFTAHIAEINHIAAMSHFNGIQLLDGSQTTIKVPVNNGASYVNVNLPNLTTGTAGLNIGSLDIFGCAAAQSSLMTLNSVSALQSAFSDIKAEEINLIAARKHDEVTTTVDMTKKPFVVQQNGPSA